MASLEWTQLWWNWKLNSSADLLYYDKINVDVVHPPYAHRDRNSSYFLKTRKWYSVDKWLNQWLYDRSLEYKREEKWEEYWDVDEWDLFDVVDVEIIYDENCDKREWTIYYMCITREWDEKWVVSRRFKDWVIENDISLLHRAWQWCACIDEKFFKTTYVKWYASRLFKKFSNRKSDNWIQINRVEGWAMRWYFTDKEVERWTDKFSWWVDIQPWYYLVAWGSPNMEWDWFCWQVRTIIWYDNATWELMLDSAWSWYQDWEEEVRWDSISYSIFSDWWEVVWFSSGKWISIAVNNEDALTICDIWTPTHNADCVVSVTSSVDRIFLLYDNWWIHFWWVGRDKFFDTGDAMFCWADKHSIVAYRDFILAMWNDKMAVAVADSTGQYYRLYNQSATIWVKNKYAYWEYNWDLLICSNDNRLLALKVASNVWQYMLEYEDVWKYINPYLKAMLPSDRCYIWVDDNVLRVYINTLSDVDNLWENTRTLVLKYNTIFWVWTCDKLWYSLLRGSKEWFFFWDSVYTRRWNVDTRTVERHRDWIARLELEQNTYNIWISAFLLENEENWQTQNNRSADLFSLAQLQKLIILLWMWRYDDSNTQLKITEYRNGFWYEQVISSLSNNTWINNIGAAYEWSSIEPSECVLSDIKDGSNVIRATCKNWHRIQRPLVEWILWKNINQQWDELKVDYAEHELQLTDHRVCINDEVYKMAPHMPLVLELWDQENYNSQIYIELVSNSDDVINFGWFMANLSLAPLWHKWADWEYLIEVDTGC